MSHVIISFVGADGVGKTTLMSALAEALDVWYTVYQMSYTDVWHACNRDHEVAVKHFVETMYEDDSILLLDRGPWCGAVYQKTGVVPVMPENWSVVYVCGEGVEDAEDLARHADGQTPAEVKAGYERLLKSQSATTFVESVDTAYEGEWRNPMLVLEESILALMPLVREVKVKL